MTERTTSSNRRSARHAVWAATGVVLFGLVLGWLSSLGDAPIVDEVPHIGAGYSYIQRWDMRLNPEHPPLVKDLSGLALAPLALSPGVFQTPQWTSEVNGQWTFGRAVIFDAGANPNTVKNVARAPVFLLFFVLASFFVWRWARERAGEGAALLAVVLLAFSPTILAHARLVTTDMAAAVGVLVATYFFLRFLREPSQRSFWWSVLSLGFAFLLKFNTVLLGPYFILLALLYGLSGHWLSVKHWKRAGKLLLLTALIGATAVIAIVWPVYIAHTWNYPAAQQLSDAQNITSWHKDNPLKSFTLWASDKPVIRGLGQWTLGLAMVAQRAGGGNTIYWLGEVVKQGGPWYFPIVYFLKEPLAWWILVAFAFTALLFHRRHRNNEPKRGSWWEHHFDEWAWALWLLIYWAVSMKSTLNIGVRHLLPVYPFTILLVSTRLTVLADWLRRTDRVRLKIFSSFIGILIGWYVFESVRVYPSYLSYFNQFAGGPSGGYRYVVDSNLDWGQDLKRFGEYVRENNISRICVDYFGWADPAYYLGSAFQWTSSTQWDGLQDFLNRNTCDGWLAVSATFLQNSNGQKTFRDTEVRGSYRWLIDQEPVAVIGHSIFVWKLDN